MGVLWGYLHPLTMVIVECVDDSVQNQPVHAVGEHGCHGFPEECAVRETYRW